MKYIQPSLYKESFTCPNCGVFSKQNWSNTTWRLESNYVFEYKGNVISVALCDHCQESSLWIKDTMYYPTTGNSPFPNKLLAALDPADSTASVTESLTLSAI